MNLDFTPEYQAFRAEVRDFLETNKDSAPRMSDRGVRSEKTDKPTQRVSLQKSRLQLLKQAIDP